MQVMIVPFKRNGKIVYCPFHCGIRNFSYERLAPINKRDFWRFIVKFFRHYGYEPKKLISWSKYDLSELVVKLKLSPCRLGYVYVLTYEPHNIEYEIICGQSAILDSSDIKEIDDYLNNN